MLQNIYAILISVVGLAVMTACSPFSALRNSLSNSSSMVVSRTSANTRLAPLTLNVGQQAVSGNLTLVFQADGNLVLYRDMGSAQTVLWNSGTSRGNCANCYATFQSDGNLVLYQNGSPYWSSGITGGSGDTLKLSDHPPYISSLSGTTGFVRWSGQNSLVWFAPLDNVSVYGMGRTGETDFMNLFTDSAQWQTALQKVNVVQLYTQFILSASDDQLKQVFSFLAAHHIALAIETWILTPNGTACGYGVEGYIYPGQPVQIAQRIKSLGGDLAYISIDEAFGGNRSTNGCHLDSVSAGIDAVNNLNTFRAYFPEVQLGDTENLFADTSWHNDYLSWADTIQSRMGSPLAFFHVDVDWHGDWKSGVDSMKADLVARKIPFGVIHNGSGGSATSSAWMQSAMQNIDNYRSSGLPTPDHLIFQTWDAFPVLAMPETSPTSHTYLINYYFGLTSSAAATAAASAPAVTTVSGPTAAAASTTVSGTVVHPTSATSNDVLAGWDAAKGIDSNTTTSYSSSLFSSSANTRATFIAAWWSPQSISKIVLTARMKGSQPMGFPTSYAVYITSSDDSSWVSAGSYSAQPDANGVVTINLPSPVLTYGVQIVPITLGTDSDGNYYFQMAEIAAQ